MQTKRLVGRHNGRGQTSPVLVLFAFLFAAFLLTQPHPPTAHAQTDNHYWQFPLNSPLSHLIQVDFDHNNIREVLVASEDGELYLLGADGLPIWQYQADGAVTAIGAVDAIHEESSKQDEFVIAQTNRLTLLAADGRELWTMPLQLVDPSWPQLLASDAEVMSQLEDAFPATPVALHSIDYNLDGREEIIVVFSSGEVQLIDGTAVTIWQYDRNSTPGEDAFPLLEVADINKDGREEIILSTFRRFSLLTILDENGRLFWDQPIGITGRVNALSLVDFPQQAGVSIAVGTEQGDLTLVNAARQRVWPRTLNVPITSMVATTLNDEPILAVGTAASQIIAFNWQGQRQWETTLDRSKVRPVYNLTSAETIQDAQQPALSAVLGNPPDESTAQDVVLLNGEGTLLNVQTRMDEKGLSQLSDLNHDLHYELILAQFSNLEFVGIGTGANETTSQWHQSLNDTPQAILTVDLDQDGSEELIVGSRNGRVYCIASDASFCWLRSPGGGNITHLAQLVDAETAVPHVVVVRSIFRFQDGVRDQPIETAVELWQANGDQLWSTSINQAVTALAVQNIDASPEAEIVLGTQTGQIHALSATGSNLWSVDLSANRLFVRQDPRIQQLLVLPPQQSSERSPLLVVTNKALSILNEQQAVEPFWQFPDEKIDQVYLGALPAAEAAVSIVAILDDGNIQSIAWPTAELAPEIVQLNGRLEASLPISPIAPEPITSTYYQSLLLSSEAETVTMLRLGENAPQIQWELTERKNSTGLFHGDLDGDSLPENGIGAQNKISLFNDVQQPAEVSALTVSGRIYALVGLKRPSGVTDLVAISTNGEVELFRAQENRPPLVTNPRVERTTNGYNFAVSIADVENDTVEVTLELFDGAQWISQGSKPASSNLAVWLDIALPVEEGEAPYRFTYTDKIYRGTIYPPPVVQPAVSTTIADNSPYLVLVFASIVAVLIGLLVRQAQLPDAKARRFYRRLKQSPQNTFRLVEKRYAQLGGSEDFLLNLARFGRQNEDDLIADYADGLYLLPERPLSGLPIILNAIEAASEQTPLWKDQARWQAVFSTTLALIDAPSIAELSLLRPKLKQLGRFLEEQQAWSPALEALFPILTDIRDSQRVDYADDRLVYLNEALQDLNALGLVLPDFVDRIEKTITAVIVKRWSNLLVAEIQALQGRAELVLTLKTRRIVPTLEIKIVLMVKNNGRSQANAITITPLPDPAYEIVNPAIELELLPAGREKEVEFTLRPLVTDHFRVAVHAQFSDQIQIDRQIDFGDMVSLLPPIRTFNPIANPYLPGTPLRPQSNIFFGREQLFHFIADNAAGWAQRNVLILIGQRRTGKTSALLRLGEHLPKQLLPIYIDCQSLGIMPGMAALFQELAWLISDTLLNLDIEIDVPEIDEWTADPRGMFQRKFIPHVRNLLPPGTILLFVFDEFEAFEQLVDSDILPTTFFTYLRHLMQHSEGISFLFVGTRRLEEMSANYWSVLFNIALYERIDFLSYRSAMRLISEPVAPNLVYDDLALDKIWRVTAGHPYFLQLVCYTLVKQANDNQNPYITISDVNAGLDEMLSLGEVHFAYIWQRSTFAEKAMLTAVANLMPEDIAFYPEDLVRFLETYNIQLTPTEVTTALTSLVERDIFKEVLPGISAQYELRIGLVGLWVAKYKSLSKLHAIPAD